MAIVCGVGAVHLGKIWDSVLSCNTVFNRVRTIGNRFPSIKLQKEDI